MAGKSEQYREEILTRMYPRLKEEQDKDYLPKKKQDYVVFLF